MNVTLSNKRQALFVSASWSVKYVSEVPLRKASTVTLEVFKSVNISIWQTSLSL